MATDRESRKKRLTDRFLETYKLPAGEARAEFTDMDVRGLAWRVTAPSSKSPQGAAAWFVRYRPKGSAKQTRANIGPYPGKSLKDARTRAMAILVAARDGRDLLAEELAQRQKEEAESRTVKDSIGGYIEFYAKHHQRRWKQTERTLNRHIVAHIGNKRLVDITREDLSNILDRLQKQGLRAQVNAVRRIAVMAFNWMVEEKGWLPRNPFTGIKQRRGLNADPDDGRRLSDDELRKIWLAADRIGGAAGDFVKVLMLCGQRRDEVRCLPRKELEDHDAAPDWLLPKARNKGKRDHIVPLPRTARDIIAARPIFGPYVFTLDGKKPFASENRLKRKLDKESGITGWKYHDLRRACSTGMAALGVPQEIIDRVLNHAKGKLARTYNKHDYLEEKRDALERWARHIAVTVSENVLELKRA